MSFDSFQKLTNFSIAFCSRYIKYGKINTLNSPANIIFLNIIIISTIQIHVKHKIL